MWLGDVDKDLTRRLQDAKTRRRERAMAGDVTIATNLTAILTIEKMHISGEIIDVDHSEKGSRG